MWAVLDLETTIKSYAKRKATVIQGKAWVSEYSGNDSTWRVYRSALVTVKRKVNHVGSA